MNNMNERYDVKLVGYNDHVAELQLLKDSQFLEDMFDNVPIFYNRPDEGNRGPKHVYDARKVVGYIVPGTARHEDQSQNGAGLYATAEILSTEVPRFHTFIDTPFGLDFTADLMETAPGLKVHTVDIVIKPRGTGKIIAIKRR